MMESEVNLGPKLLPWPPELSGTDLPRPERQPRLHHRSCTECGRRKVRCDRHHPCANCVRASSECIFPKSRRTPARQKKTVRNRDEELLKSLRRLNRQLQSSMGSDPAPDPIPKHSSRSEDGDRVQHTEEEIKSQPSTASRPSPLGPSPSTTLYDEVTHKREEGARLVLDHDRSRYISNNFWASMSREIEEMRDILDGSSSEQEDNQDQDPDQEKGTPSSRISQNSRDLFIFSPSTTTQALQSLYPSSANLLTLFDVFLENVDPVVRIFHRPTLRTTISEALPNLDSSLDRHTEVVMFSISYAALTSLNETDCQRLFQEEQRVMLPRYRHAVEQSLARARFLDSQNLAVLAALVLFLLCVRRHDNSRFVSSLLGVVIRNAQAMGLHRDGTYFKLSPYETEMRRRLWWHICVLDIRASEDHGCDPSIYEQSYDTRFPLNINDEDISPNDTHTPPERPAGSDMTFCLLRFEVSVAIRKLNYPAAIGSRESALSTSEKRSMIEIVEKHFYDKYINRCDITKPFDWVSATWAQLMLAKMWLAVSNPLHSSDGGRGSTDDGSCREIATVPLDLRSLSFQKSVEVLELSDLLETGHRATRWRWLFLTHVQWHAVVFVLAYLCLRPNDDLAHRAWRVVDRVYERWPSDNGAKKGMLWKPIRRLVDRAQQIRASKDSNDVETMHDRNLDELPESVLQTQDSYMTNTLAIPRKRHQSTVQPVGGPNLAPISHSSVFAPLLNPIAEDDHNNSGHLAANGSAMATFHHPDVQFDLSMQSHGVDDLSDPQSTHPDWTNILHELQIGVQDSQDVEIMDLADEMQGYGRNLWNTL